MISLTTVVTSLTPASSGFWGGGMETLLWLLPLSEPLLLESVLLSLLLDLELPGLPRCLTRSKYRDSASFSDSSSNLTRVGEQP